LWVSRLRRSPNLLFDVTAESATRMHSGATAPLPIDATPSLYRASSPTTTATGRQPCPGPPVPVGSETFCHATGVADPSSNVDACRGLAEGSYSSGLKARGFH
jgi:hypothetical protein